MIKVKQLQFIIVISLYIEPFLLDPGGEGLETPTIGPFFTLGKNLSGFSACSLILGAWLVGARLLQKLVTCAHRPNWGEPMASHM